MFSKLLCVSKPQPQITNLKYILSSYNLVNTSSIFSFRRLYREPSTLVFNMIRQLFFINIMTPLSKTFFYLSPGIIINFARIKRCLKKSTRLVVLMLKLLNKFLYMIDVSYVKMFYLRKFKMFRLVFSNILVKIGHPFHNPLTQLDYDPDEFSSRRVNIKAVFFRYSNFFTTYKTKKSSRLKKKITRKLIKTSNLEF